MREAKTNVKSPQRYGQGRRTELFRMQDQQDQRSKVALRRQEEGEGEEGMHNSTWYMSDDGGECMRGRRRRQYSQCYRSMPCSKLKSSASRSSGGMSPRWRSCSGRRFRLPGELVMMEKLAVVGEMLPADDDTDLFATWLYPLRDEGPLGIDE